MANMNDLFVAVIVDVSHSRSHPDRGRLQRDLTVAFEAVNRNSEYVLQPLAPTIGDEFQAVYGNLPAALRATLLARLSLPKDIDCRFGIGYGEIRKVGLSQSGAIQDGSAWWSARDAINNARNHEYSKLRFVRTWYGDDANSSSWTANDEQSPRSQRSLVNSFLLLRDQIIGTMSARSRQLVYGHLTGRSQSEMARQLDISQSAVSQALRRSGAEALVASESYLNERVKP